MTEQNQEPQIYKVPVHNMKWFETKFRALIKKAEKCGAEIPSFVVNGQEEVTYNKGKKNEKTVIFNLLEVAGMRPAIAGWEFVARIEHTNSGNLIKARPDFEGEDMSKYYHNERLCEHCNTQRNRKYTYVVQEEATGKRMQVGNSCLTDFLGHASPDYYARLAEFEGDVYELFRDGGAHPMTQDDYMPLQSFLETALNVVKLHEGYRTASAHGSQATSHQTSWFYFGSDMGDKERRWSRFREEVNSLRNESEDSEKIAEVIKHHAEMNPKGDFQQNMHVIAKEGMVTYKDFGIACYMIQNYYNFEKKKAEWQLKAEQRAKEMAGKKNEWIGEVKEKKERREFEVTYMGTASFAHQFGTTYFHRFEDSEGRLIVAKVSKGVNYMVEEAQGRSDSDRRVQEGDKFIFKASIVKHDEYKGRKQTYINRIKMVGYEIPQSA
jgi:hypothetical protein